MGRRCQGQKILLNFFRQFEGGDELHTMPEPMDHCIGVSGDDAKFIVSCHRNIFRKVTTGDLFQNTCLIIKEKPQVSGIGENQVHNHRQKNSHDEKYLIHYRFLRL